MIDLLILATLLPGPCHGYQLKRRAGMILGQENLHNNLVYPLLRRFMTKKWVSRKTAPGERGQTRQMYSLTSRGRKELVSRLSAFSDQDARNDDAFRFRVGMFQLLDPEVRLRILESRQQFLRSRIEKLRMIEQAFELDCYASEVTRRLLADSKAELAWVEHLRRVSK